MMARYLEAKASGSRRSDLRRNTCTFATMVMSRYRARVGSESIPIQLKSKPKSKGAKCTFHKSARVYEGFMCCVIWCGA